MDVTVLLFASYADALGCASTTLRLAPGATAGDALSAIRCMPGAERLPDAPLLAVNEVYARSAHPLSHGDRLAVIPPVAGG
jgi:molybdopterin converting factor small subunit